MTFELLLHFLKLKRAREKYGKREGETVGEN